MDGWMFSVLTGITISAALRLKRHKLSPLLRRLKIAIRDSDRSKKKSSGRKQVDL